MEGRPVDFSNARDLRKYQQSLNSAHLASGKEGDVASEKISPAAVTGEHRDPNASIDDVRTPEISKTAIKIGPCRIQLGLLNGIVSSDCFVSRFAVVLSIITAVFIKNWPDELLLWILFGFFVIVTTCTMYYRRLKSERQIIRMNIDEKAMTFHQNVRQLQEDCVGWSLARACESLSGRFEAFYSHTLSEVNDMRMMFSIKELKSNVESQFSQMNDELSKINEVVRRKQLALQKIQYLTEEIETQYVFIEQRMVDTANYIDETLGGRNKHMVSVFKKKVVGNHEAFTQISNVVNEGILGADDGTADAQLVDHASKAHTQHSGTLKALKSEMAGVLSAHAEMIDQQNLARAMKNSAVEICCENELHIFKLPVKMIHTNDKHLFRHYKVGDYDPAHAKPRKVIIMVGMTGAGKTLGINNIINFVYGIDFNDNFRFKLIVESEEIGERVGFDDTATSNADSMTSWISSYTLHYCRGFRVPYTLVLIDTPGFGDTRGPAFDEKVVENIKEFFSNKTYPIDELSGIGLVIQASQSRLTAEQMYVFNAVLNIFGNDVVKNICPMFTFADAQPPPALQTVKKELPTIPIGSVFKFNNSALYALNDDEGNAPNWKFGMGSLDKFFVHIREITPASLSLTKEVLDERESLHRLLDGLQKQISDRTDKLIEIENMTQTVNQLNQSMEANKNIEVKKTNQRTTEQVDHQVVNCKSCKFTCQDSWSTDYDTKGSCPAMKDGRCTSCPGKCPWKMHTKAAKKYVYIETKRVKPLNKVIFQYKVLLTDRRTKFKMLDDLLSDYKQQKDSLFSDIQDACSATVRLEEISLGKSILTSVDYIERLIELERCNSRPNKQNRINQLQKLKGRAEALSKARGDIVDSIDEYEKHVMEVIEKLKEEIEDKGVTSAFELLEQASDTITPDTESESESPNLGVNPHSLFNKLGPPDIKIFKHQFPYSTSRHRVNVPLPNQSAMSDVPIIHAQVPSRPTVTSNECLSLGDVSLSHPANFCA